MKDIQRIRRDLHQIPELDKTLPKTIAYIKHFLSPLFCEISEPCESAIAAYFDFHQKETLAFRSDMDALPIQEQHIGVYTSKHMGQMHACGHDGHMAILLKFAQIVHAMHDCKYNVLLLFQPAEETSGGAKALIASGILTKYQVKAIFAFHVWPLLPKGMIASKPGVMMAKSAEVNIDIKGKATHIANAETGKDALVAAVNLLHQIYEMDQKVNDLHVLKFGYMQSGSVRNAISDHTKIQGTLRTLDLSVFDDLKEQLYSIAHVTKHQYHCQIQIEISEGYPLLINDPALFAQCKALLPDVYQLSSANLLSEDFAYYGKTIPALFFYLGIGDTPPLHSPIFDFDDRLLSYGVETYIKLLQL